MTIHHPTKKKNSQTKKKYCFYINKLGTSIKKSPQYITGCTFAKYKCPKPFFNWFINYVNFHRMLAAKLNHAFINRKKLLRRIQLLAFINNCIDKIINFKSWILFCIFSPDIIKAQKSLYI